MSVKAQAQISMLLGPLGCHTRREWELVFITEKLGNTVPYDGVQHPGARAEAGLKFLTGVLLVVHKDLQGLGGVLAAISDHAMAVAGGDIPTSRSSAAGDTEPGAEGGQVGPLDVVGVADEVLGGELPVAGDDPLVDATEDFGPALAPVEERVEVPGHGPEVFQQRRSVRIEGGEYQSLVRVKLGHWYQAPLRLVELVVVGVLEVGHGRQLAVSTKGPAVVGADECPGVAVVGSAEAIATVAADVEESVDLALPVAGDEDGIFAHVGGEEIARVGDLGLVAEEEPATRKDLLQFLLVDGFLAEDAGADQSLVKVDQRVDVC